MKHQICYTFIKYTLVYSVPTKLFPFGGGSSSVQILNRSRQSKLDCPMLQLIVWICAQTLRKEFASRSEPLIFSTYNPNYGCFLRSKLGFGPERIRAFSLCTINPVQTRRINSYYCTRNLQMGARWRYHLPHSAKAVATSSIVALSLSHRPTLQESLTISHIGSFSAPNSYQSFLVSSPSVRWKSQFTQHP